jgi:hypothetical protein
VSSSPVLHIAPKSNRIFSSGTRVPADIEHDADERLARQNHALQLLPLTSKPPRSPGKRERVRVGGDAARLLLILVELAHVLEFFCYDAAALFAASLEALRGRFHDGRQQTLESHASTSLYDTGESADRSSMPISDACVITSVL